MKLLTKEEEDAHYRAVLRGGISGGLVGLGVGLGASMLLQRRWAFYRTLTLPLKAFLVSSTGTFCAIIQADRYSRNFEVSQHAEMKFRDTTARRIAEEQANMTTWEKAWKMGRDYRYTIVTSSWAASMVGSFWWVSRDRYLTTAQKLVQARVYAQGLTLLILVATAAFEVSDSRAKEEEQLRLADPNHPVQKRIHHEHYQGEDMWRDMVEAEEKRLAARRAAAAEKLKH
ncbi:mitochondrial hypoxia responsive domain-containing protein [Trichophaea hybrida]|nr:mitochondrial hypoxia responsive domain-containing protein [Trichophaea hybrida]